MSAQNFYITDPKNPKRVIMELRGADAAVFQTYELCVAHDVDSAAKIAAGLNLLTAISPHVEHPLGELRKTGRGFQRVDFKDRYGSQCSLQESSLATEPALWLGVDDAQPQIMKSDAAKLGLPTVPPVEGWQPFVIPAQVLLTTRMHLTEAMVRQLMWRLNQWLNTNSFAK